ncbi:hypothetical protein [Catenulispora sp. MAP12-49]|uniref:hypothetical protein n=1 Tax=Catenulispora sp. MAP12-49 TaxID=3156302 RepID=UPI00351492AB
MSARGEINEKTVNATRILAQAFPDSYTTQLVEKLLRHSYFFRDHPDLQLSLLEEAVDAARRIKETEPMWPGLVINAISRHAAWFQEQGRWSEAMDVFAELERYRGLQSRLERHPGSRINTSLDNWATALEESGLRAEAVELWYDEFDHERTLSYSAGLPWTVVALTDTLEALERFDEAVAVFSVGSDRSKPERGLCDLVHLARIHQAAGNRDARVATLEEAASALAALPRHDKNGWPEKFYGSSFKYYLVCSTRADEPPRSAGEPDYSYGSYWWSPGLRARFHGEAEVLLAESSVLPHGPDRVIRHRRATVRLASALMEHRTHHRLAEPFDEGVHLAEQAVRGGSEAAPELLARALLDRAQYRATCQDFAGAAADFGTALDLVKR